MVLPSRRCMHYINELLFVKSLVPLAYFPEGKIPLKLKRTHLAFQHVGYAHNR